MGTFLKYAKPLLTAMIQAETPDDAINTIAASHYDGAEAFGIQLENLKREYRREEELRRIFSYCAGKPIYITSYRNSNSTGMTDDECAEYLLLGLHCGATLCDIKGDFFCPTENEITYREEAVKKQKALAEKIHKMGGEVIFSSHLSRFFSEEEIISYAREQVSRGADIVKIVSRADTEEQLLENLKIAARLKKEIPVPYLFLASGAYCKLLRQVGPALGVCMYLCVEDYRPLNSKEQPLLRAIREVRDRIL